jgi:hypothetical protein
MIALSDAELDERLVTPQADLSAGGRTTVATAHEEGSYVRTAENERGPLVSDGRVVSYDGQVFAVRTTRVGVERQVRETFDVTYTGRGDNTTVEVGDDIRIVDYDELTPTDRAMFDSLDPERMARDGRQMSAVHGYDYPDDADSLFIPRQELIAVEYEGHTFLVQYEGRRTDENGRYRYELDSLAPDVASYVEHVVDEHRFTLRRTDLSEGQREMVDTAIEEGYGEEKELSDDFATLIERIESHDPVERSYTRSYIVRYEGTTYYTRVEDNDREYRTTERPYRTTDEEGQTTVNGTATDTPTA